MGLLDDVVDQLAPGRAPNRAPVRDPSPTVEHREPAPAPRTTAQALPEKAGTIRVSIFVEAMDDQGRSSQVTHQIDVSKGSVAMAEMMAEGDRDETLRQIATSVVTAAAKSMISQPAGGGNMGAVLNEVVTKPGPVGGRQVGKTDPLANMLGLDIIEHADALDLGAPPPQQAAPGPRPAPRPQPRPMGGPHMTGPRPLIPDR